MSKDRQQCSDDWKAMNKQKEIIEHKVSAFGSGVVKEDKVNNPAHYTFGKYEVIDVIEGWGLDKEFHLGNTIKYIARAKHKGNELEDLKKAQWYLSRKISQLEKR